MKRIILAGLLIALLLASGCRANDDQTLTQQDGALITVGFSQVGAESEWRVANTESMKKALSEDEGYVLIYDDARQKQENQIRAIRAFIQQDVDYIVLSPNTETGWEGILLEARDAGIPVILVDRFIQIEDEGLYAAYIGSDFRKEGDMAVEWLQRLLKAQGRQDARINIVHIQGTLGSSAQLGRSAALTDAIEQRPHWRLIVQECGDFTRAKAYEVMADVVREHRVIDVVYCENDGEALGAIDVLEDAGFVCNAKEGVIVLSFDATNVGLQYCLDGKISVDVECNPLQGPYVADIIQAMERGEPFEKNQYIKETIFDCFTITQAMIDSRDY